MCSCSLQKEPLLFVVSAPSGAGKTSLCNELIRSVPGLSLSVSHTTRLPRQGEIVGKHYIFVSRDQFQNFVEQNAMAEWTEIYGNCYGTSKETVRRAVDEGCDLLFDIDERGARQLRETYQNVITILVLPPSLEDLRKRLIERGTEDEQSVSGRLEKARQEIRNMLWYEYVVVNKSFAEAAEQLKAIVAAERCKRKYARVKELLGEPDCDT